MPVATALAVTVQGTLEDVNSVIWTSANIIASLRLNPGTSGMPLWDGQPFSLQHRIIADTAGHFAIDLPPNTEITPPGTVWHFVIAPSISNAVSVQFNIFIAAPIDISALFHSESATQIPRLVQSLAVPRASDESQVVPNPNEGQMYFNTHDHEMYFFSQGGWKSFTLGVDLSVYLEKAGGTMTGPLELHGPPATDDEASNKKYVDDEVDAVATNVATNATDIAALQNDVTDIKADYLPLAGGVITGTLDVQQNVHMNGSVIIDQQLNVSNIQGTGMNINASGTMQFNVPTGYHIRLNGPAIAFNNVDFNADATVSGELYCPRIKGSYISLDATGGTMILNAGGGVRIPGTVGNAGNLSVQRAITANYVNAQSIHGSSISNTGGYAQLSGTFVQIDSQNILLNSTGPNTDGISLNVPYGGLWQNAKIRLNGELYCRGSMMNFEIPAGSGYFTLSAPHIGLYSMSGHGGINLGTNFNISYQGTTYIQNNLTCANLTVNGTATKPGGGSWAATSDARLKTDVEEYTDGMEKISQLSPIKFRYNSRARHCEDGKQYVGLAAEAVKEVMPQMVGSFKGKIDYEDEKESDILTVDPSELLFTIINSLKEIDKRLAKLEEKK